MVQDEDKPGVHEGFPNPATDGTAVPMDLNQLVVKNPASTFYMRIASNSYEEIGVFKGDILVIDRSLPTKPGRLAVVISDGELMILMLPKSSQTEFELWGMISYLIHQTT